jgi:CXXX repeat peptide maturase
MLNYLIVLLSDDCVSFCNYKSIGQNTLIPLDVLKESVSYAMKENLSVQYVFPEQELPEAYYDTMNLIDHCKMMPITHPSIYKADLIVADSISNFVVNYPAGAGKSTFIVRVTKDDLFGKIQNLFPFIKTGSRLNIILTDIETFTSEDFDFYKKTLSKLSDCLQSAYNDSVPSQLNLLTDRIVLNAMNNCNAGVDSITLAPNGAFYICPAFYYDNPSETVGSLREGLKVKNRNLYEIGYAPICRNCDAYQCKRCVWLNRKTTLELNTPSHEQCLVAHLERNTSRDLLAHLHSMHLFTEKNIAPINYLDPFEKLYTK